jgi:hypothetical protein
MSTLVKNGDGYVCDVCSCGKGIEVFVDERDDSFGLRCNTCDEEVEHDENDSDMFKHVRELFADEASQLEDYYELQRVGYDKFYGTDV